MNTKKILLTLITLILSQSLIIAQLPTSPYLRTKKYYKEIFSSTDLNKLNAAYDTKNSVTKFITKKNTYQEKADKLRKSANLPIAKKKADKYRKKADKFQTKADKYAIKAFIPTKNANATILSVYQNYTKNQPKENKQLFTEVSKDVKTYKDSVEIVESYLAKADNQHDKAIFLQDINFFQNQQILFSEYLLSITKKDKKIIDELNKKYKISEDEEQEPENTQHTENQTDTIRTDKLFVSKQPKLDEIIQFTNAEKKYLDQYYTLGTAGINEFSGISVLQDSLNKITKQISGEKDFIKKRNLINKKNSIKTQLQIKQINGINKFISANNNYYNARKNHLKDFRPSQNATNYNEIVKYENLAKNFYNDYLKKLAEAQNKAAGEKFKLLDYANDQLITALEYQENAFCLMIGLDTAKVTVKHKLPSYIPQKDKYLYTSHNPNLDKLIAFSEAEKDSISGRIKLAVEANKLLNEKSSDTTKNNLNKAQALKKYISANAVYYNIRKKHINDNVAKDAEYFAKFNEYQQKADIYFKDYQRLLDKANKMQLAKSADTLEKANNQLITANQYLENAYCTKIGLDTFAVTPKFNLKITHKQIADNGKNKNKDKGKNQNKDKDKTTTTTTTTKTKKISGLYWYSAEQRTPRKATTPSGTIYRVQVGTSKYLLPVNELKEYGKIYYETLTNSQYKRFLVGDYTDLESAKQALKNLKSKGYKDAYIVTYQNGKRKGATYTSTYTPQTNNTNSYYNAKDITKTRYLIYAVRIGTFSSPKTSADLKNLSPLYYKKLADGRVIYYVAPFYKYTDAQNKLKVVKQKGFTDAYIVAYNNGQPTTIETAKKIEQNVAANSKIVFRVQIGAFSDYLSTQEVEKNFGKITGIFPIHTHVKNNLIIYSAGDAKTYEDAQKIKKIITDLGYQGCYIIAFKGDKQVPVSTVR